MHCPLHDPGAVVGLELHIEQPGEQVLVSRDDPEFDAGCAARGKPEACFCGELAHVRLPTGSVVHKDGWDDARVGIQASGAGKAPSRWPVSLSRESPAASL
jgi:hypothetical protein